MNRTEKGNGEQLLKDLEELMNGNYFGVFAENGSLIGFFCVG